MPASWQGRAGGLRRSRFGTPGRGYETMATESGMRMKLRKPAVLAMVLAAACALANGAPAAADAPTARLAAQVTVPAGVTAVAAQGDIAVAISTSGGSVSIIDATGPTVRSTTALPEAPSGVALSPDGTLAYVATDHQIIVVATATGALVRSAAYDSEPMPDRVLGGQQPCGSALGMKLRSPATTPDGRLLSFVGDCQGWPVIWSIDPATMLVTTKSFTYLGRGGLGFPIGPLAAFADQAIVTGRHPDDYCLDVADCGPTPMVITSKRDIYKGCQYASQFPAGPFSALTRDPVTGSLLASQGQSLVWVNPATGAQSRRLGGVGSSFSDLKVDSSTGLVYGRDGQGTVVVDPAEGRVLGMILEPLDAVSGGRGYHATATGIDVIDVGSGLVPTRPPTVTAKVGRAVKGTANATITWQAPASAGSSPVTGYRVQASSYRNAKDKKPAAVKYTVSAGTTSSRLTLKQVRTTNAKAPAFYAFTVTPINAVGDGAAGSTQVAAPRR